MPETRLSDIVQALDDQEFQVKMAALEAAYAEDPDRQELLVQSVELLKEAKAAGEVEPMSDSQMLSLAAQLVEDHIAKVAAENGEAPAEAEAPAEGEGETLTEEDVVELGKLAGEALREAGLTDEDLAQVQTPEESELLGRTAAQLLLQANENTEE